MDYQYEATDQYAPAEIKAPENVLLGLIGALVGAVLGGASIVLLSRLGYVASLSGVLTAFCTLKGYELLGKRLSKRGVVICVIIMVLATIAADLVDWAFVVLDAWGQYGVSFFDCLLAVPELIADGSIAMFDYLKNLGMLMLFMVLGAFATVEKALLSRR